MKREERDFRLNIIRKRKAEIEPVLKRVQEDAEQQDKRAREALRKRTEYRRNRGFFQTMQDAFVKLQIMKETDMFGFPGLITGLFDAAEHAGLAMELDHLIEEEAQLLGMNID